MARYDRTVPPGGEGKITLEVHTSGYQGNVHKSAQVLTNDPKRRELVIGIKGTIWVPILQSPRRASLVGVVGEDIETTVSFRSQKEAPLALAVASFAPPADEVDVELRETEKGRSYELKIKNKIQEEARYQGRIKIETNYPEKPILMIPYNGWIKGPIEIRPKSLSFGSLTEDRLAALTQKGTPMTRALVIILNKGNDLEVVKTSMEHSLFKVISSRAVRPGRMFEIQVGPLYEKLKKGPNQDLLTIHTNQPKAKVLEVPIHFNVM